MALREGRSLSVETHINVIDVVDVISVKFSSSWQIYEILFRYTIIILNINLYEGIWSFGKEKITVAKRNSYNTANSFSAGHIFVLRAMVRKYRPKS